MMSLFRDSRDELDNLDGAISPLDQGPGQDSQLDALRAILDGLVLKYNAKNSAMKNTTNADYTGTSHVMKPGQFG